MGFTTLLKLAQNWLIVTKWNKCCSRQVALLCMNGLDFSANIAAPHNAKDCCLISNRRDLKRKSRKLAKNDIYSPLRGSGSVRCEGSTVPQRPRTRNFLSMQEWYIRRLFEFFGVKWCISKVLSIVISRRQNYDLLRIGNVNSARFLFWSKQIWHLECSSLFGDFDAIYDKMRSSEMFAASSTSLNIIWRLSNTICHFSLCLIPPVNLQGSYRQWLQFLIDSNVHCHLGCYDQVYI